MKNYHIVVRGLWNFLMYVSSTCTNIPSPRISPYCCSNTDRVLRALGLASKWTSTVGEQDEFFAIANKDVCISAVNAGCVRAADITSLISGARLAHILRHRGPCVEQKCKGGGGDGESHDEQV